MAKHTPGKWVVEPYSSKRPKQWAIRANNRDGCLRPVGYIFDGSTQFPPEEREATARLIAAAPDLLATLKALEYPDEPGRFCDHAAEPCPRCEAARAAIAKAEATSATGGK